SKSWNCEFRSRQTGSNFIFWKRKVGKISIASDSSDEQKRSNYQIDTRIVNGRLPNELRSGCRIDYTREGQRNQTGPDDGRGSRTDFRLARNKNGLSRRRDVT